MTQIEDEGAWVPSMNKIINTSQAVHAAYVVMASQQMVQPRTGALWFTKEELPLAGGVLLQAVIIVPGSKTPEGTLIEAVSPFWLEFVRMMEKDPLLMHQLTPRQWEEMIAAAYSQAGYDDVTLTPQSGDHGRDVIAVKRGICVVRIIDQVKAYKPGNLVTADDVRALMGVLQGDGASKGCLTTTSDFAPKLKDDPLIKPFIGKQLELVDGKLLRERLTDIANAAAPSSAHRSVING
jgi:restriction system protein